MFTRTPRSRQCSNAPPLQGARGPFTTCLHWNHSPSPKTSSGCPSNCRWNHGPIGLCLHSSSAIFCSAPAHSCRCASAMLEAEALSSHPWRSRLAMLRGSQCTRTNSPTTLWAPLGEDSPLGRRTRIRVLDPMPLRIHSATCQLHFFYPEASEALLLANAVLVLEGSARFFLFGYVISYGWGRRRRRLWRR